MELDELIELLKDEQARRCVYGTRQGDGKTCDCKYDLRQMFGSSGAPKNWRPSREVTGCPEFRSLIRYLEAERERGQHG